MKLLLLVFALFGATYAQFSATAQADILKVHNDLRSQVALGTFEAQGQTLPGASDMQQMQWYDELAQSAQAFANTCPDEPSGSEEYGESSYYAWSEKKPTNLNVYGKKAALSWKNEFENFDFYNHFDENAKESGPGDNFQMIWSRSYLIGCGVKNCGPDRNTFTQAYKIIVICHYYEKGNNLDENVYEEGESCSNCLGYVCDQDSGLCQ